MKLNGYKYKTTYHKDKDIEMTNALPHLTLETSTLYVLYFPKADWLKEVQME